MIRLKLYFAENAIFKFSNNFFGSYIVTAVLPISFEGHYLITFSATYVLGNVDESMNS